jgi:hypothetical protein
MRICIDYLDTNVAKFALFTGQNAIRASLVRFVLAGYSPTGAAKYATGDPAKPSYVDPIGICAKTQLETCHTVAKA